MRKGNLAQFNQVLVNHGEKFQGEDTYILIIRLRHNVIKTGVYILITLGPTYNEFGYNELPPTTNPFLCIKINDFNVRKFGYCEHSPTTNNFLCVYLRVLSGTQCKHLRYNVITTGTYMYCKLIKGSVAPRKRTRSENEWDASDLTK